MEAMPALGPASLAWWTLSCGFGPWPQQPWRRWLRLLPIRASLLGASSHGFVEISVQGQPSSERSSSQGPGPAPDLDLTLACIGTQSLSWRIKDSRSLRCSSLAFILPFHPGWGSRKAGPSPYASLYTCTKKSVNVPWHLLGALAGLLFARALTPTSPCCWAGAVRWKSTCEVRTLLSA